MRRRGAWRPRLHGRVLIRGLAVGVGFRQSGCACEDVRVTVVGTQLPGAFLTPPTIGGTDA
jgi:hypothetical protein